MSQPPPFVDVFVLLTFFLDVNSHSAFVFLFVFNFDVFWREGVFVVLT